MTTERVDIIISERGSRTVKRNLDSIGGSATTAQSAVQLLRSALGALTAGIGLASVVSVLASFSQEMSTVRAIAQATEQQFVQLRDTAEDLGATTRFSATQAAEGMVFLARAGFDANEVLSTIDDTLRLAQAGALDLASAADIASNVMKGFRLENDQAARAVDVLAFAANNANTNVLQLGDAMKFVAPVAAGMGVSMEEAAAAITQLSDAGLQGSLAGTGLRRVLSELESPSSKTEKLLKTLGLTTRDVRISTIGLTGAIKALADAGIDTGQALELFGDRGGPAFEVLQSSIPGLIKMNEELNNAGGTALRIATIMDDNLNGALLATKSASEAVTLSFGKLGAESKLTNFFLGLAGFLRNTADNLDLIVDAALFLAGVFILKLTPAIIALTVALLTNPFGLIVSAIAVASVALAGLDQDIKIFGVTVARLGDIFRATFDFIGELVSSTFKGFMAAFETAIKDIPNSLKGVAVLGINGLIEVFEKGLNFLFEGINNIRLAILRQFQELPGIVGRIFTKLGTIVSSFITGAKEFDIAEIIGFGDTGALEITLPRLSIDNAAKNAANAVIQSFKGEFDPKMLNVLSGGIKSAVENILERADVLGKAREVGKSIGDELGDSVNNSIENKLTGAAEAGGIFEGLAEQIRENFLTATDVVANSLQTMEDALVDFVSTGKLSFKSLIDTMIADIARLAIQKSITGPLANLLGGLGSGGGGGFLSSIATKLFGGGGTPGLAHGGSIELGGRSGTDNNLLSLNDRPIARVSKGEELTVTPSSGTGSRRPTIINFNIQTKDAESFRRSSHDIFAQAQVALADASRRDN